MSKHIWCSTQSIVVVWLSAAESIVGTRLSISLSHATGHTVYVLTGQLRKHQQSILLFNITAAVAEEVQQPAVPSCITLVL